MVFFVAAWAMLLHLWFWGAGAAILLTPRPWQKAWPIFCGPFGLALQSAVVWAGAYSGLAGTQVYARWTEILPVALLAIAGWRRGGKALAGARRFGGLALLVIADLGLLVLPMAKASRALTTLSLGSCDAADYAAGARVLQEFARDDRSGFIGLTEVVRVASVDNFYDFWLRLNHFTPSALIAFNGAVFGWRPHEITGILCALLLAVTLPAVFWMARMVLRYSKGISLWLAAIYGLNPITWYAVAHVAIGQLLAAHAIVFLTWAGVALWRDRLTWRRGWAMGGVLAMGYWIILGSYNFIVVICLAPVLTYVGAAVLLTGRWRRFGQWLVVMLVPLGICGLLFTQRTLGLVERFQLFGQYDFGWHIPVLSPEGWLGGVTGPGLGPLTMLFRWTLRILLFVLLVLALKLDLHRRRRALYRAVTMILPVMTGYCFLEIRGAVLGTNASYDAYKVLAVFFPCMLCGHCYWVRLRLSENFGQRWAARVGIVGMTIFNLVVASRFMARMQDPPLIVDADLAALQAVESRPEVTSINMNVDDFWTRLWANAMLLHKPQYFATHTYEGRRNTALKGRWDLTAGVIAVTTPAGAGAIRSGHNLMLQDRESSYFLEARLGEGWYPEERLAKGGLRWNWASGDATLTIENSPVRARLVRLRLKTRSPAKREVQVWQGDKLCGRIEATDQFSVGVIAGIVLPPGRSTLVFRSGTPPAVAGGGDPRPLSFAVYRIKLEEQDGAPP